MKILLLSVLLSGCSVTLIDQANEFCRNKNGVSEFYHIKKRPRIYTHYREYEEHTAVKCHNTEGTTTILTRKLKY